MKRQSKVIKPSTSVDLSCTPNNKKQIQSPSYTNASLLEASRQTQQYIHEQSDKKRKKEVKQSKQSKAYPQKTPQKRSSNIQNAEKPIFVQLNEVSIPNDEANFFQNIIIGVRYTISHPLQENLRWKLIYLGSAFSENHDQVLLNFETPDTQRSISSNQREFKLQCMPPKIDLIPPQQLFSVSAIVLSVSYMNQQFARVGFYIHYQTPILQPNQQLLLEIFQGKHKEKYQQLYQIEKKSNKKFEIKTKKIEKDKKHKPSKNQDKKTIKQAQLVTAAHNAAKKTIRTILIDKPRFTKFQIQWQKNISIEQQKKCLQQMEIQKQSNWISEDQRQLTEYFQPIKKNKEPLLQKSTQQHTKPQGAKKITRIVNTWTLTSQGDVICNNVQRYYE